ncbi:hypothetical protein BACIH_3548 [Bacillus amyloliquefaciens]|nr:hypothetical protein BACIH_3548 [Bacillus amyloliquefaciens]
MLPHISSSHPLCFIMYIGYPLPIFFLFMDIKNRQEAILACL